MRRILVVLCLFLLLGVGALGQNYHVEPYLRASIQNSNRYRVKFQRPDGSVLRSKVKYIPQSHNIRDKTFHFLVETGELNKLESYIGSNHFLNSALWFENGDVRLLGLGFLSDLKRRPSYLPSYGYDSIPAFVSTEDTVRLRHTERSFLILTNLSDTTLIIGNQKVDCIQWTLIEKWPNIQYTGKVFLNRNYGVVRWERITGRVEEIILK